MSLKRLFISLKRLFISFYWKVLYRIFLFLINIKSWYTSVPAKRRGFYWIVLYCILSFFIYNAGTQVYQLRNMTCVSVPAKGRDFIPALKGLDLLPLAPTRSLRLLPDFWSLVAAPGRHLDGAYACKYMWIHVCVYHSRRPEVINFTKQSPVFDRYQ